MRKGFHVVSDGKLTPSLRKCEENQTLSLARDLFFAARAASHSPLFFMA